MRRILFIMILLLPFIAGCVKTAEKAVEVGTGLEALEQKIKTDKDLAQTKCILLCKDELAKGADLSNGPCIGNPIAGLPDWVCDVAHRPRQKVDNNPKNQCSAFRKGEAKHFVEVDELCNVIKVY